MDLLAPTPQSQVCDPTRFRRVRAFTLVELLVVVAILSILAGGLAQALNGLAVRNRVHPAAIEFVASVREARSAALRENALVRLAFVTPEEASRGGSTSVTAGYGLFIFKVPAHDLSGSVLLQPTLEIESDSGLREFVPTSRVPITRSLLGAWQGLDGYEQWSHWSEEISVSGNVVDSYAGLGFAKAQEAHLWQPSSFWTDGYSADAAGDSVYVEYPRSFARTPSVKRARLVNEAARANETVLVAGLGQVSSRDLWGTGKISQWSDPDVQDGGQELPALDFTPEGRLAGESTGILEFRFSAPEGKPPVYVVKINEANGEVWIE